MAVASALSLALSLPYTRVLGATTASPTSSAPSATPEQWFTITVIGDGTEALPGSKDGFAQVATISKPRGALVGEQVVIFASHISSAIYPFRRWDIATNEVTTMAGLAPGSAIVDGPLGSSVFDTPSGMTWNAKANEDFFVADFGHRAIRRVNTALNEVTTVIGPGSGHASHDGVGTLVTLAGPTDITYDLDMYIADSMVLRRASVGPGGEWAVSTFAGFNHTNADGRDGVGTWASFLSLNGVVKSGESLYVADSSAIRRVLLSNANVTRVAGSLSQGQVDGHFSISRFGTVNSIDITTSQDLLYVSDSNHIIRRVDLVTDQVTTVVGTLSGNWVNAYGAADGVGMNVNLNTPLLVKTAPTLHGVLIGDAHTVRKAWVTDTHSPTRTTRSPTTMFPTVTTSPTETTRSPTVRGDWEVVIGNEIAPSNATLRTTVHTWHAFTLQVQINPLATSFYSQNASIFHFTSTNANTGLGSRLPAMFFKPDSTEILVCLDGWEQENRCLSGPSLPLNTWTNVLLQVTGNQFRLEYNNETQDSISDYAPFPERSDVMVYSGSPWAPPFDFGTLKNLEYQETSKVNTKSPTTIQPSVSPSTCGPTSLGPTTYSPSTSEPSQTPTTLAPSQTPTSMSPSTGNPTSTCPSTRVPSYSPTTYGPTSRSPTSQSPATNSPETVTPSMAPSTCGPTTNQPTRCPTSENPTTSNPTYCPSSYSPTSRTPTLSPTSLSPTASPTGTEFDLITSLHVTMTYPSLTSSAFCSSSHPLFASIRASIVNRSGADTDAVTLTCNTGSVIYRALAVFDTNQAAQSKAQAFLVVVREAAAGSDPQSLLTPESGFNTSIAGYPELGDPSSIEIITNTTNAPSMSPTSAPTKAPVESTVAQTIITVVTPIVGGAALVATAAYCFRRRRQRRKKRRLSVLVRQGRYDEVELSMSRQGKQSARGKLPRVVDIFDFLLHTDVPKWIETFRMFNFKLSTDAKLLNKLVSHGTVWKTQLLNFLTVSLASESDFEVMVGGAVSTFKAEILTQAAMALGEIDLHVLLSSKDSKNSEVYRSFAVVERVCRDRFRAHAIKTTLLMSIIRALSRMLADKQASVSGIDKAFHTAQWANLERLFKLIIDHILTPHATLLFALSVSGSGMFRDVTLVDGASSVFGSRLIRSLTTSDGLQVMEAKYCTNHKQRVKVRARASALAHFSRFFSAALKFMTCVSTALENERTDEEGSDGEGSDGEGDGDEKRRYGSTGRISFVNQLKNELSDLGRAMSGLVSAITAMKPFQKKAKHVREALIYSANQAVNGARLSHIERRSLLAGKRASFEEKMPPAATSTRNASHGLRMLQPSEVRSIDVQLEAKSRIDWRTFDANLTGHPVRVRLLQADEGMDDEFHDAHAASPSLGADLEKRIFRHSSLADRFAFLRKLYGLGFSRTKGWFAVLQCVPGVSIHDWLNSKVTNVTGTSTERRARAWGTSCRVALAISKAVDTMHKAEVAHEHLTPRAIFIDENNNSDVTLASYTFPLADSSEGGGGDSDLQIRWLYCAPEVCIGEGGAELTREDRLKWDVFSMGTVLLEILTRNNVRMSKLLPSSEQKHRQRYLDLLAEFHKSAEERAFKMLAEVGTSTEGASAGEMADGSSVADRNGMIGSSPPAFEVSKFEISETGFEARGSDDAVENLRKVLFQCVSLDPVERPTSDAVVDALSRVLPADQNAENKQINNDAVDDDEQKGSTIGCSDEKFGDEKDRSSDTDNCTVPVPQTPKVAPPQEGETEKLIIAQESGGETPPPLPVEISASEAFDVPDDIELQSHHVNRVIVGGSGNAPEDTVYLSRGGSGAQLLAPIPQMHRPSQADSIFSTETDEVHGSGVEHV